MFNLHLIGGYDFIVENVDGCTNTGPCCLCCPAFDTCDAHYDPEDDEA